MVLFRLAASYKNFHFSCLSLLCRRQKWTAPVHLRMETFLRSTTTPRLVIGPVMCLGVELRGIEYLSSCWLTHQQDSVGLRFSWVLYFTSKVLGVVMGCCLSSVLIWIFRLITEPITIDIDFDYDCEAEVRIQDQKSFKWRKRNYKLDDFSIVQGIFFNPEDCGSYVTCNSDNEGGIKVSRFDIYTQKFKIMNYE